MFWWGVFSGIVGMAAITYVTVVVWYHWEGRRDSVAYRKACDEWQRRMLLNVDSVARPPKG